MRPLSYAKRLTEDLDAWIGNGWVSPENAALIRASLDHDEAPSRLPIIITVLGAVLIGFSVMAFVAANWSDMSKGLRLAILAITMWSAYGTAAYLHLRNQSGFVEAALLIGVSMFGASIMLIGQMYHLPSNFSAGLLVWSLGALATAWAVKSKSALIVTQLLLMGWTGSELSTGTLHFAYLLPWIAASALAIRLNWTPTKHLALIGLFYWMLGTIPVLAENIGWGPFEALIAITSASILIWIAGLIVEQQGNSFGRAVQAYGAAATFIFFWIGHIIDEGLQEPNNLLGLFAIIITVPATAFLASKKVVALRLVDILALSSFPITLLIAATFIDPENGSNGPAPLIFSAPIFLLLCIWLVTFGTKQHNRFLINLGFAAFGAEALYLYLETFGTLLDTSVFFAIGGILLIAGGFIWEKLRRRATASQSTTEQEGTS